MIAMKQLILKHPQVDSLEQWRDDSGRSEGWAAHLKPGWNSDGCSFVRGMTLAELRDELKHIKQGEPY